MHGAQDIFQTDPHWQDLILFYEYFHGDNGRGCGASHQTGWTALVAKLLQQSGEKLDPLYTAAVMLAKRSLATNAWQPIEGEVKP